MSVYTTLLKEFKTGTISIWTSVQTKKGQLRAYSNNGKVIYFKDLKGMDAAVQNFKGYGYTSRSKQLIKQLSLI